MTFRTDEPSFRAARRARIALALGVAVGIGGFPACSEKPSDDDDAPAAPPISTGGGGASAVGGQGGGGTAGAGEATPPVLGVAGNAAVVVTTGGKASTGTGGTGTGGASSGGTGAGSGGGSAASCQPPELVAEGCVAALENESAVGSCNQRDDDCDGKVDEGCSCEPGTVQPCFVGPPGRRGVGACADGSQVCIRNGELETRWDDCKGGIRPSAEVCDTLDNDCNGCADDFDDCVPTGSCPGPGDPRVPDGTPLAPYTLRGSDFFKGDAAFWSWRVEGGICDALTPNAPSFTLTGANSETATFTPQLSGDYRVTLTVTPATGPQFVCTWIVHIEGPGLRIEMCYPESSTLDLDLFVKQPGKTTPWFTGLDQYSTSLDQCCWANCEANLRGDAVMPPQTVDRADWGYPTSPVSACQGGPQGASWQLLGYCANPRLDIDNNLVEGTGVPENINVDAPRDGETFRIMVANFSGPLARPLVNVYCDGHLNATIGAAPNEVPNFTGQSGSFAIGALWRAADVTTHVTGTETTCTVGVLRLPGSNAEFDVTYDDPRY